MKKKVTVFVLTCLFFAICVFMSVGPMGHPPNMKAKYHELHLNIINEVIIKYFAKNGIYPDLEVINDLLNRDEIAREYRFDLDTYLSPWGSKLVYASNGSSYKLHLETQNNSGISK